MSAHPWYLVVKTVSGFAVLQHVAGPGPYVGESADMLIGCTNKGTALGHAQRIARDENLPGPAEQDAKEREWAEERAARRAEMERRWAEEARPA